MNLTISKKDPLSIAADTIIIGILKKGLTPTGEKIDKASGQALTQWIKSGDVSSELGKVSILRNLPGIKAQRVVCVGLGAQIENGDDYVKAIKEGLLASKMAHKIVLTSFDWIAELSNNIDLIDISSLTARTMATSYDIPKNYKTNSDVEKRPKEIELTYSVNEDDAQCFELTIKELEEHIENSFSYGCVVAKGIQKAKELGDMPANYCTPSFLAEEAMKLSPLGIDVTVFDEKALSKLKMGCLLGVAQGSKQPPRMIVMEYQGGKKGDAPIALIGKGLTFDSGGVSLKPGKSMDEMKYDMSGAAAMIATIATAAALKLPKNIVAVVGCTENMPGGAAVKPGDILTSYAGKTVEVLNTDAEGRLVLCDLISYAIDKFKPSLLIDAATLTGACVVALGHEFTGMYTNAPLAAISMEVEGTCSLDRVWHMPLTSNHTKSLKSNFADLANIGSTPYAGSATAAAFLKEFVGQTPWIHLDVAGTAWNSGQNKGSTGRPVPLLTQFLIRN